MDKTQSTVTRFKPSTGSWATYVSGTSPGIGLSSAAGLKSRTDSVASAKPGVGPDSKDNLDSAQVEIWPGKPEVWWGPS